MRKIVVYDFDGTLSYGDSMEELFNSEMTGPKFVYRCYYFFLKVLSKLKLSTVKREKEKMIKLLFHSDEKRFKSKCEQQAQGYKVSPIMHILKKDVSEGNRVIVLSASSVFFLNSIFKGLEVELMGTTFTSMDGKILSIAQHPFYHDKVQTLVKHNVPIVDEAYFDSRWDECLKPMCRKWYKVYNGEIIESALNDVKE